jgi:NUMOD3 motif.
MTTSLNKIHRKIWHEQYGDIPVDEFGITYEIHHINGDHNDNRIENLKCVSIIDHYNIHASQGDWYACTAILQRLKRKLDSIDGIIDTTVLKGEMHPMYGKNHSEETKRKISENHHDVSGENNPMYGKKHSDESKEKMSNKLKGNGKGVPKSAETRRKMSESVRLLTCPHCGKSAKGNSMKRWHFDNCKRK